MKYPRSFREAFAQLSEEECRAAYYLLAQAVDNAEVGYEDCGGDEWADEDTKKLFEHTALARAAVDKLELLFAGLAEKGEQR